MCKYVAIIKGFNRENPGNNDRAGSVACPVHYCIIRVGAVYFVNNQRVEYIYELDVFVLPLFLH